MARPKMIISEYRNYELPTDFPILALYGDHWQISPVPSHRLHFHNCVEIGLCRRGSGIMMVGDRQFPFSEGTVTFIAPHISHTTWSSPDTYSLWTYLFADIPALLGSLSLELPDHQAFADLMMNGALLLDPEKHAWARHMVASMVREVAETPPGYRPNLRGLLLSLSVQLMRIRSGNGIRPQTPSDVLTPALDYIRENYAEDFYMETLSDLCHLSPTHFRRLFQQQLGTTPLEYLHRMRISASCSLLLTSSDSVTDIASAVGYTSLSCFNRHFLRYMGTTPSRWRREDEGSARKSILTFTGWAQPETSDEILRKQP